MVDPSVLFSEEGISWLQEDPTARHGIVLPATVMQWLRGEIDLNRRLFIAPEDLDMIDQRREQLLNVLDGVSTFSHPEVDLPAYHQQVLRNLLEAHEHRPASNGIHADEWAFLQSQSSLISKLRNPLDAFRDAGSAIVELGRNVGWRVIRRVIPPENIPPLLTPKFIARVAGKWIVLGGAALGGGTLGGMAGSAAGPAGTWIGAKAGSIIAEEATRPAVLAIDP